MMTVEFPPGNTARIRAGHDEESVGLVAPFWNAALEKVDQLNNLRTKNGVPICSAMRWRGFEPWWFGQSQFLRNILLPSMRYRPVLERAFQTRSITVLNPPKDFGWMPRLLATAGVACKVIHRPPVWPSRIRGDLIGLPLKMAVSLVALTSVLFTRRRIAIYTRKPVDGADPLRCDRRFREIYAELKRRNLRFMEMVYSVRNFDAWREQSRRRRLVVHYHQLCRLAGWLVPKPVRPKLAEEPTDPIERAVVDTYWDFSSDNMRRAAVLRLLLRLMRPLALLAPDDTTEIGPMVAAAKSLRIPVVCFQHGVSLPGYHLGLFCTGRTNNGALNHGADTYFVWSEFDAQRLLRSSRLYSREQIHVGGPIRPMDHRTTRIRPPAPPLKILWIGETLAYAEEARPFVEAICRFSGFEVKYRPRPERTLTAKQSNMIRNWGLNIEFSRDRTLQEDLDGSHVVIGTYSTVLLECYARMVPSVYMRVPTDLVGFDDMAQSGLMVASSPEELATDIEKAAALSDEELLRLQHFLLGPESSSGSRSIMDHLETLLHRDHRPPHC